MTKPIPAEGEFACRAARVFDGEKVLVNHAVLVAHGSVTGVVPVAEVPADMPALDEPDATILPGLIDMHMHFMRWEGPLFLAYGVTTVRDVGNNLDWILARRAEWRNKLWPRILCTGPVLDGPHPVHPVCGRACADQAAALTAIEELAAVRVDGIKMYVGLPPEWYEPMVTGSHDAGLKVSIHCYNANALAACAAGVDEFMHLDGLVADLWPGHPPGWLDVWGLPGFDAAGDRAQKAADRIRQSGAAVTPTLAYWDSQWRVRAPGYPGPNDVLHVPETLVMWESSRTPDPEGSARWRRAMEAAQKFIGLLRERDVPILVGTDVPCGAVPAGLSLWREMALLVGTGMTPLQVLQTTTSRAAAFLGHANIGRLFRGTAADLVFVKGDPVSEIPEKPEIPWVVRGGTVCQPAELLASAAQAHGTMEADPWGIQFKLHWQKSRG